MPKADVPGAPEVPTAQEQAKGADSPRPAVIDTPTPTTGRAAFRGINRQLNDADLTNPAVGRLLLDAWDTAEERCRDLTPYVERFHEADKRAAVLAEKARTAVAVDVAFGVVIGIGTAILGTKPDFWLGAVGALLVIGGIAVRVIKR
jgi:hypothetical protein